MASVSWGISNVRICYRSYQVATTSATGWSKMESMKQTLERVRDDASKLLTPAPKGPLHANMVACIPRPRPAAQVPTSDDVHLAKQSDRQQEIQKHSDQVTDSFVKLRDDKLPPAERAKQLWGVLRGVTGKAAAAAASTTSKVVHDANQRLDQKAFQDEFGAIVGSSGMLLHSFSVSVLHAGKPIKCTLHVTSTHLCLEGGPVKDFLPLGAIASLIPCVALPTSEGSLYFVAVPDPRVRPTSMQIYTAQKYVWELASIGHTLRHAPTDMKLDPLQLLYGELDRAWRSSVTVPLSNISYA